MAARIVKHAFEIMHLLTGEVGHLAVFSFDNFLLIFFSNSVIHKDEECSSAGQEPPSESVPPFTS